ncbi:UPF0481 protein At3g47200-like [Abrus precatorius]|uniref:UPF0481 protein At3g47200-like n=1 Tax=Abrus precatorius TaxID=3816 RepID=A0A8B8K0R2_ABRPR|nr:UPF0481 protein At3g47200-like [Abrus precatorius]
MQQQDFSWMVPIEVMLGSFNHGEVQACSISIVPDEIREEKEKSFKPKFVSIGPLHRGTTRHLQLMEEPKWSYMREFLNRTGNRTENRRAETRLRDCGADILKLVKVVSASYGGTVQSEPNELAKIMIVDGCFLLELLIKLGDYITQQGNQSSSNSNDTILENKEKVVSVLNDITMLENQIPFIVLKKLYRKVFQDNSVIDNDHRVANIVRKAFGYPEVDSSGGAHVLHLMHLSTVQQDQQQQSEVNKRAKKELKRCAARLIAAGVTIQPAKDGSHHNLVDKFNFMINFKNSALEIPELRVKETTEVRWRNLIAWEQSKIWVSCKYTSYALFFQGLICCKHDIEMLLEKEVIINEANKSKEELLDLFRTMSKGAERMDSSYSEICNKLNEYRGRKIKTVLQKKPLVIWHKCRHVFEIMLYYWGNWYRILIRDHIPTVWKFIGVLAAVALLVLTIMQTYYSAESAHSSGSGSGGGGGKGKG